MKREPNPYASNPVLTVTNTMSISVPSMVAEDVIDGDADKIIGADPSVVEEIKEHLKEVSGMAVLAFEEVAATQHAMSTMKSELDSTSRLAYGLQSQRNTDSELYVDVQESTGLTYLRLSGNGEWVEVTVADLQNLVNGGGSSGTGAVTLGPNVNNAVLTVDTETRDTMAFSVSSGGGTSGTELGYYKIAASGFVSSDWPNAQLRLYGNASSNMVELQLSSDYGNTWHSITSSSDSSSGSTTTSSGVSFIPYTYNEEYSKLAIDQSSGKCIKFVSQTSNGNSQDTGLGYGLQVALAAFDNADVKLRLSGSGTSPKLQVRKGWDAGWEDFAISGGSSNSGSSGSDSGGSSIIALSDSISSLQVTDLGDYTLLLETAYKVAPSDLNYCTLAVDSIASAENTACRLRVSSSGTIQTSTNNGATWNSLDGGMESLISLHTPVLNKLQFTGIYTRGDSNVLAMRACGGNNTSFLSYYSLATRAIFFIDNSGSEPEYAIRPTVHGLEWSNNAGQTWKVISPSNSSNAGSADITSIVVNTEATADYNTPVRYLTVETAGDAYSAGAMNDYADDSTFYRKSWEPSRLQTIELGGHDGSNEFTGIVALRNYLAVPVKTPRWGKIEQQAPANTEHVIMGVHNMGVLQFSSGIDFGSYQTFKIDLRPFMPDNLHGSTEPITSKIQWLLDNTEALAALLNS